MAQDARMIPLCITATMAEPITSSFMPPALDSMLARQVKLRERAPHFLRGMVPELIDIPIALGASERFYLASFAQLGEPLWSRVAHVHRRAPSQWYARLCGPRVKRVDTATGADKGYRIPRHRSFYHQIHWWCIGDPEPIRDLLSTVLRIGSCRRDGIGRRREWSVAPCESWGEGFPVMRDGQPLRTLPLGYPGLVEPRTTMARLMFPYFIHENEEMVACPQSWPH